MAAGASARVMTALVTPFDAEGRMDSGAAAELAARLCARGSDGFVVAGTTGESPTLTADEKLRLCRAVRDAVDGRAEVWLNAGTYSTRESVELARAAEGAGAQGVMAVVPYYNRPPQQGLLRHFAAVAGAGTLPLMPYNVPTRTACNLLPATLAALAAEAPAVVAVKEASHDLDQAAEIVRLMPAGFRVYSGDDQLTLPMLSVGGWGVVSVASHIVPDRIAAMLAAFTAGRVGEAARLHRDMLPLCRALFCTTNPIPVKAALELAGFPVGGCRPPLCAATPEERARIERVMRESELVGSLR